MSDKQQVRSVTGALRELPGVQWNEVPAGNKSLGGGKGGLEQPC